MSTLTALSFVLSAGFLQTGPGTLAAISALVLNINHQTTTTITGNAVG